MNFGVFQNILLSWLSNTFMIFNQSDLVLSKQGRFFYFEGLSDKMELKFHLYFPSHPFEILIIAQNNMHYSCLNLILVSLFLIIKSNCYR